MYRLTLLLAAFVCLSVSTAAAQNASTAPVPPSTSDPDLDAVRSATERFRDVEVALAEGYLPDPMGLCDTAEMMGQPAELGAMGIHYIRPDLLAISATEPRVDGTSMHTDFLKPSVLIYEPQPDGSLELVAIENLVFKKAWDAAGYTEPPAFAGVPYDFMIDDPETALDEAHMFAPHYDRHVWLYRENPNGIFAQYNPDVTCKHHSQPSQHQH